MTQQREKLTPFDIVDYLDSDEAINEYLRLSMKEDDPKYLMHALGDVARARGMTTVAEQAKLGRQNLYKALSGNSYPRVDTFFKVLKALDVRLTVA